ncbi:BZIP domain-containing protein, partial [Trichostrongylus colubriformis]
TQMDLQDTLSALIRQPTAMQPTAFPFSAFLQHPLMTSLPFSLANIMEPSLLGVSPAEPQPAVTPKKARLDSPCSPLSQSSTVSSTQLSSPQASPVRKLAKPIPDEKKVALLKSETARLRLLLFSRQHLSAVTPTKTDNKSGCIDALLHGVSATVLPSDTEVQP